MKGEYDTRLDPISPFFDMKTWLPEAKPEVVTVNVHEWLNYQNTLNHAANQLVEARQRAANMGLTDQVDQLGDALATIFAVRLQADEPL